MMQAPLNAVLTRVTVKHAKNHGTEGTPAAPLAPAPDKLLSLSAWFDHIQSVETSEGKLQQAEVKIICAQLNFLLLKKSLLTYNAVDKGNAGITTNLHIEGFETSSIMQKKIKLTRQGETSTRFPSCSNTCSLFCLH